MDMLQIAGTITFTGVITWISGMLMGGGTGGIMPQS